MFSVETVEREKPRLTRASRKNRTLHKIRRYCVLAVCGLAVAAVVPSARADNSSDPYENYVKTSKDFKRVKQDKDWVLKAYPSWIYMPWTFKWTIGYTPQSGKWSLENGFNGAFLDGQGLQRMLKEGKLDWINQFHLRFYMDHSAGKGYLHLWDGKDLQPPKKGEPNQNLLKVQGTGVRAKPVNEAMRKTLEDLLSKNINSVKSSPWRAAYALDDEISWGSFIHSCMWRITDDHGAYENWLKEIYGPDAPQYPNWISYDDIRLKLKKWSVSTFDASQLMDQWTFNDSYWCNFLGDLVEYANSIDPNTPVGFVGGQSPSTFGFDYAKIMRKIQFIEAYNLGSSQAVIRSFNPHTALPQVTTHFHNIKAKNADDDIWQVWYYLGHGNKGMIGWVENWFAPGTNAPAPWIAEAAPTFLDAANKIGPLMSGAEWKQDGVAIYYSQSSIQMSWILDNEAFNKTWTNNNSDFKQGTCHLVAHAWENMLRDSGIQYNFLSYVDVIQDGVPSQYKVLILPAAYCLSDAEARQIRKFCENGGTVIADFMPGLWDQHGKGRKNGGALDDLFGVKQNPSMTEKDVFGGSLWVETNQDKNFNKGYEALLTNGNDSIKDASGFDKAVRDMPVNHVNKVGKGAAILMNLSPQWYNVYRTQGFEAAQKREVFMKPIEDAGVHRWVAIKNADDKTFGYEITYFTKGDRTIGFVCFNPEVVGSQLGGGNSAGLKSGQQAITLSFAFPVHDLRDERTGKSLGAGKDFNFNWKMNEAVVFSFANK